MSKCSQLLCPAPALLKSYFMCMDRVLIFFFFLEVVVSCVYIRVLCTMETRKEHQILLGLESQMVMSHHVSGEIEPGSSE